MKYIGAVLIFLACSGTGVYRAMLIKKRLRTLSGLISALEILKGEICARLSDLPCAVKVAERSASREICPFFKGVLSGTDRLGDESFGEIWRESALQTLGVLMEGELNAVIDLGQTLGRYDAGLQRNAIDLCSATLSSSLNQAALTSNGGMRASIGAGVSLGAMILITLF